MVCQNQDKREKSVKLWRWPSSLEQVTYSNHSPVCAPLPELSILAFQGPGHHSIDWPRGKLFPPLLPTSPSSISFPLGSSQPDCPDSLPQCHKDQHLKFSLPGLPPLPSFLPQGLTEGYGEKREWGESPVLSYITGCPALCQVRTNLRDDQVLCQGGDQGGAQEVGRGRVEGGGERWERYRGVETRQRVTLCWLTYQGSWCIRHFCLHTSLLVPAADPCPSALQPSPGIMGKTHI